MSCRYNVLVDRCSRPDISNPSGVCRIVWILVLSPFWYTRSHCVRSWRVLSLIGILLSLTSEPRLPSTHLARNSHNHGLFFPMGPRFWLLHRMEFHRNQRRQKTVWQCQRSIQGPQSCDLWVLLLSFVCVVHWHQLHHAVGYGSRRVPMVPGVCIQNG